MDGSGRLRLWVIEDNAELRGLIAEVLDGKQGIQCEKSFATAEAALLALEAGDSPDVILSDINLPGISGIEAIPLIQRLAPGVNVVVMTTFYDGLAERRAQQAGARGFILKGEDTGRFVEIITHARDGGVGEKLEPGSRAWYATPKPACESRQESAPQQHSARVTAPVITAAPSSRPGRRWGSFRRLVNALVRVE
jgi:DNA-binding NarL/FixJ family response regulator